MQKELRLSALKINIVLNLFKLKLNRNQPKKTKLTKQNKMKVKAIKKKG